MERSAALVARWQAYGFCHGVLNSDNMSITGDTFDYGPWAFLDQYRPGHVCNHSDEHGRYAFDRQPEIVLTNLAWLAEALAMLAPIEALNEILHGYNARFRQHYRRLFCARIGLDPAQDWDLADELLGICEAHRLDWTRLLRALAEDDPVHPPVDEAVDHEGWSAWETRWRERIAQRLPDLDARRRTLCAVNPCMLPRTHLMQQAIDKAEQGDFSEVRRLHDVLRTPFSRAGKRDTDLAPAPEWAAGLALSCSS
jgi:uncharacterized protein YdiU (UPF0061 family)